MTVYKDFLSKNLPLRDTKEEAQADLDRWAQERKLERLRTCRVCGYTVYDGGRWWVAIVLQRRTK